MCLVFSRSLLFLSVPFLLAMVFSLLFRFTASDYPFGIFNLLLLDDTHTYIFIYICCGTCLIRHTKGPWKCVGLYRMSEYSGFILVNRTKLGP